MSVFIRFWMISWVFEFYLGAPTSHHQTGHIETLRGLQDIQRHNDDATTCEYVGEGDAWSGLRDRVLRVRKRTLHDLGEEHFVLGIMTPIQKEILLSFGKNVVCMDSILIELMRMISLWWLCACCGWIWRRFPVAWCISNREDRAVLTGFLLKIWDMVGQLETSWLMYDDAEQCLG